MNANWEIKKLGDIITLQRGHDLPSQARKHGQIPIMGSSGITGYHNQFKAKGPGVIIGRSGNSMGQVSYVSENYWPLNTCLYVTDFKGNCPEFIYYFLKQINFEQFNSGSAQKSLNRNAVYPFEVKFPTSYKIQSAIASILFALENKIKLNQEINQTLEQMAQALFKSWFIDFEPVKAKIAVLEAGGSQEDATLAAMIAISGKNADSLTVFEREHPKKYAELRATAELFPSAMQESELGNIPEGWEVSTLAEKIKIIGGGTPKRSESDYWGGDICWYSVKDAPRDGDVFVIDTVEKITSKGLNNSSTKLLPIGTTIISARGTVGKLALVAVEMAMNQSCYGISGQDFSGPFLTYLKVKQCIDVLKRNTHGAVFDTITTNTFETVNILTAHKRTNDKFEEIITPLFNGIKSNLVSNAYLSQLRDILLPKLLSGEITLPEAEEIAKEADYV